MAGNHQLENKMTIVQVPLASGGTDVFGTKVDMQGFDGVRFIGILGTAGSTDTCNLKLYSSTTSTATSTSNGFTLESASLTATSSAGESDKGFDLECYRPRKRYVTTKVTRSAAVEYGGTIALQYGRIAISSTRGSTTLAAAAVRIVPQTTG